MPMDTFNFENGGRSYRIQFQIVSLPPAALRNPGLTGHSRPRSKHSVDSIRVVEITEGVGEQAQRRTLHFNRDFQTLAQARTRAGDYARRIVREQMAQAVPAPAA